MWSPFLTKIMPNLQELIDFVKIFVSIFIKVQYIYLLFNLLPCTFQDVFDPNEVSAVV